MRPDGMALAPKQKFLFHVYFSPTNPGHVLSTDKGLIGALVKTIQLPSFKLDTGEYVQYNRKRLVHNRINYEPVTIKLHDDSSNNVLALWNSYYTYYFADSSYHYSEGAPEQNTTGKTTYNSRDIYSPTRSRQAAGWGKTISSNADQGAKPAFFKDITVYGMSGGKYTSYTLINPVITSWRHDTYDYAESAGVMEHEMQIQYEAVKYGFGDVGPGGENIPGFGEANRYDTEPGALGPGSTSSTFGQGGITDTFDAVGTDLASGNILGAVQKAGASVTTFGSAENLANVVTTDTIQDATSSVLDTLRAPDRLLNFPSPGDNSNVTNTTASPTKSSE